MRVQPEIFTNEIKILFNLLLRQGDEVKLVGGCVRNYILGKKISDYDLATRYKPQELMEIFDKNNVKYYKSGMEFGTITAIVNNQTFEITSLRKDIKTDGRHAVVEFTNDYRIDAERRDFTINALYCDVNGNIYDYFDGISDLKKGIIRFIGDPKKRIVEDNLRILRFFRFYSYYAYSLDYKSLEACTKYANSVNNLSKERIAKEFSKIFEARCPINSLQKMQDIGILQIIFGKKITFKSLEIFYSLVNVIDSFEWNYVLPITLLMIENTVEYRFLITKKEKDFVKILEKNILKKLDLFVIKKLLFELNNKYLVKNIIMMNICLNYRKEYLNFIKEIDVIETPKFQINGGMLESYGFQNNKDYSKILTDMKKMFVDSDFKLNTKEILDKYKLENCITYKKV